MVLDGKILFPIFSVREELVRHPTLTSGILDTYTEAQIVEHVRLKPATIEALLDELEPLLPMYTPGMLTMLSMFCVVVHL